MTLKNLFFLLLIVSVLFSCSGNKEDFPDLVADSDHNTSEDVAVKEVVGTGRIEPENRIMSLASASGGLITNVFKFDGDRVKKGETIIILDDVTEKANLDILRSRIRTMQIQISLDSCTIKESEVKLASNTLLLESSRSLYQNGAETAKNLEDLVTEVSLSEIELARNKYNMKTSESKLDELRKEEHLAKAELDHKTLKAPVDGIILNMKVTTGSSLSPLAEYCDFAPDGKLIARCEIDEMFADYIKKGQTAKITLVGSNDIIATGKVIRAAPSLKRKSLFSELPGDKEDRRVREIWIILDEDTDLLYNLQVECIISVNG